MPVSVKRTIAVKTIVTQELKAKLGAELQAALAGVDAELSKLRASSTEELASGDDVPAAERRGSLAAEISRRQTQREQILAKLKEVARLDLGSEITQGSVEGHVEVKTGDDWPRLFAAEIVLKDGMVVAIRE